MTRFSLPKVALGGALFVSVAALSTTMTLTPSSHDYGQVILKVSTPKLFLLTGTSTYPYRSPSLKVSIQGPDAADFVVDSSLVPLSGLPASTCTVRYTWKVNGQCHYVVDFRPRSIGVKTAQLVADNGGGLTATATLKGEGIFGCRPYLVPCNYADSYMGKYSVTTDEAAPSGNNRGHWVTTVDIELLPGGVTCAGTQNDWEEEWNGGKLAKRSTATGSINGPGLLAIEFRKPSGGPFEYVLSFACPSPTISTTEIDHRSGTSSSGSVPSEPADWRRSGIAADPQPATQIGMKNLQGTQRDPRAPDGSGSGVTGWTTMTWSFQRWQ